MARIGIFSGTFDPVHNGHIAFCQAAISSAKLTKIMLLPEAEPRSKQRVTSLQHRHAMLQLVIGNQPQLELMVLPDAQFTIQRTLPELQQRFAGDELVLLVGSDVVPTFAYRWPGLEVLLRSTELVVGLRGGDTRERVQALMNELQKSYPRITLRFMVIDSPESQATSSRIRAGNFQKTLELAPTVTQYIAAHRLYTARANA